MSKALGIVGWVTLTAFIALAFYCLSTPTDYKMVSDNWVHFDGSAPGTTNDHGWLLRIDRCHIINDPAAKIRGHYSVEILGSQDYDYWHQKQFWTLQGAKAFAESEALNTSCN